MKRTIYILLILLLTFVVLARVNAQEQAPQSTGRDGSYADQKQNPPKKVESKVKTTQDVKPSVVQQPKYSRSLK